MKKINPADVRLAVEPSEEEKAQGILIKHIRLSELPEDVQKETIEGLQDMIEEHMKD